MKIVKGFRQAKPLLNRETPFLPFALSTGLEDKVDKDRLTPEQIVKRIIDDVRDKGDEALLSYTEKLDRVKLSSLEVTRGEISAAYQKIDRKLVPALELAASRIDKFHSTCKQRLEFGFVSHGLGRQVSPLDKVKDRKSVV